MDETMRHTFRRRRHTSNWLYTILAVCFLLVTLCIISLIPGISGSSPENTGITPSPDLSGDEVGLGTSNSNPPEQENHATTQTAPYITITINQEKFSSLVELYHTNASALASQSAEEIRLQLQELAFAREQLLAEREEFRVLYENSCEALATERSNYLQKQKDLQSEAEVLRSKLSEVAVQLSEYDNKLKALESDRQKLSKEETALQERENQLEQLNQDITHAREQITAERRELESGIQSIKENPNLSSENKETALIPLYAALEQLLMREAQLEHSGAEFEERSQALLADKENLSSRLQSYEEDRKVLDAELAPHQEKQQELTASLKAAEAGLLPLTAELERIDTQETALGKEYQDKLAALSAEEARITQEEQTLKKQLASPQAPSADSSNAITKPSGATDPFTDSSTEQTDSEQNAQEQNVLAKRTMERILIILQEVPLSEDSNLASDLLLTDVADITLTMP